MKSSSSRLLVTASIALLLGASGCASGENVPSGEASAASGGETWKPQTAGTPLAEDWWPQEVDSGDTTWTQGNIEKAANFDDENGSRRGGIVYEGDFPVVTMYDSAVSGGYESYVESAEEGADASGRRIEVSDSDPGQCVDEWRDDEWLATTCYTPGVAGDDAFAFKVTADDVAEDVRSADKSEMHDQIARFREELLAAAGEG